MEEYRCIFVEDFLDKVLSVSALENGGKYYKDLQ
jgi:hypothetical protein